LKNRKLQRIQVIEEEQESKRAERTNDNKSHPKLTTLFSLTTNVTQETIKFEFEAALHQARYIRPARLAEAVLLKLNLPTHNKVMCFHFPREP